MALVPVNGTSYQIMQINGQKIVSYYDIPASPSYDVPEIYIRRIPHMLTEMELLDSFTSIGPVWKFRLMMTFSGHNRGYGYLQYICEHHFRIALSVLNGKEIIPGRFLSACRSHNNCTLVMGGLRRNVDPLLIVQQLEGLFNLRHVGTNADRGYIRYYITFPTHREAALGRRVILSEMFHYGNNIWIKWAQN